jgi:hypothetical protein
MVHEDVGEVDRVEQRRTPLVEEDSPEEDIAANWIEDMIRWVGMEEVDVVEHTVAPISIHQLEGVEVETGHVVHCFQVLVGPEVWVYYHCSTPLGVLEKMAVEFLGCSKHHW